MDSRQRVVSILAIDTASRSRVVCVVATPEGTLVDSEVIRGETVSAALPRALGRMLPLVDRAVVVVTGPGTYTGVRAGMAGALGIADARHLPLYGVGALEVVACADRTERGDDDWVATDAGRGALYVARRATPARTSRIGVAAFDAAGARVISTDDLAIDGLVVVDAAEALGHAVALAMSRPAMDRNGLRAIYVD
jgi:tRNA threonylcarbamoyl adenosine modification protein YeaZ